VTLVLFACVHNAGRSQMAAAWFNEFADPASARAVSAGTAPGARVHPEVVETMREVGMELVDMQPRFLSDEVAQQAHWLITMGCGEACPVVPGIQRDDWPLEDPKNKPLERVREIREEVRARVLAFVRRHGWGRSPEPAQPNDLPSVVELLREVQLPTQDIEEFFPEGYAVVRGERGILGVAGVERYGADGLLRSVAVAPEMRRAGLGELLVGDRLRSAGELGLSSLYLLTTTAPAYFGRLGFQETARADAPPALQQSTSARRSISAGSARPLRRRVPLHPIPDARRPRSA
jgi:arsenate reductase